MVDIGLTSGLSVGRGVLFILGLSTYYPWNGDWYNDVFLYLQILAIRKMSGEKVLQWQMAIGSLFNCQQRKALTYPI